MSPVQHATTAQETDSPFGYCGQLQQLLETRTAVGKTGRRFDDLPAISTENNLKTLRNLAVALRPARTLEIGLAFGGSAVVFAATHREVGEEPAHQHSAIDPFQSDVWDGVALQLIDDAGLTGYLDFHESPSSVALPRLVESGSRYDLVYIDGSHVFEDVFVDYYFVNQLLNQNGLVLFDDSSDPHVRKVLRFLATNMRRTFRPFDLESHRPDGENRTKYRLKKLVGRAQLTAFQKIGPTHRPWDAAFTSF